MITEATIIGAGLLTAAAAGKFASKTGILSGTGITNNFMEENNMKTTGPIITETPKKSTDKRFEIDDISKKISKLELELLELEPPSITDWINRDSNRLHENVPKICKFLFIYDGNICYLDEDHNVIGGDTLAITTYCCVYNKTYPLDMIKSKDGEYIRKPFSDVKYDTVFYDELGSDRTVVELNDVHIYINDNRDMVLGANSINGLKQLVETENKLSDWPIHLKDTAVKRFQPVWSEPIIRFVPVLYTFETSPEKLAYDQKVKEITEKIQKLSDDKIKCIRELKDLITLEEKKKE